MTSWWIFLFRFPPCDNSLPQCPPLSSLSEICLTLPLLASTVPNSPQRVRAYLSICVEPGSILRYPTETPCMWGCTHQETVTEREWYTDSDMKWYVRGDVKSCRLRNNAIGFFLFFFLEAKRGLYFIVFALNNSEPSTVTTVAADNSRKLRPMPILDAWRRSACVQTLRTIFIVGSYI